MTTQQCGLVLVEPGAGSVESLSNALLLHSCCNSAAAHDFSVMEVVSARKISEQSLGHTGRL